MYFKRNVRQGIGFTLIAAMSLGNVMSAWALPEGVRAAAESTVSNGSYEAQLDLTAGSLLLSKNSDTGQAWNTVEDGMVPGTTMLLGADGTVRAADAQAETVLGTGDGALGVYGLSMTGELDGVKSYFMFGSDILCLGAGIESRGINGETVINVVDNVPVDKSLKIGIPNPWNGFRNVLTATQAEHETNTWKPVLDTATKGKQTRNWIIASGLSDSTLEWAYLFGESITDSQVYYRFPTKGTGIAQSFELWVEPVDGAYEYTLASGGKQGDYANGKIEDTGSRVLSNTESLQAAERPDEGILAVNKWTFGEAAISGQVADVTVDQPAAVLIKKDDAAGTAQITVGRPDNKTADVIELTVGILAEEVLETSGQGALVESSTEGGNLYLKLDASKLDEPASFEVSYKLPDFVTGESITMVRGDQRQIEKPEGFSDGLSWSAKFVKADGTYLRNVGSSKIKRELQEGETDGTRVAGDTSAEHLLTVKSLPNGNAMLTAKEKGKLVLVAKDTDGKEQRFEVEILYEDPANLPEVTSEDYAKIREAWKVSLVGTNLAAEEGGQEILDALDEAAKEAWDAYAYKGEESCGGVPFPADVGAAGNADTPYEDDAVEFRPAFKKVLAMAQSYAAEGSAYYQNADMLKDMTNILDYLCTVCYAPKSQTDNWWTWEIGIPKDLIPALILIYDGLTREQVETYTEALLFFQPDPYHEGAVGTASTHAQGYREAQGANIIDCSTTAVGLGALLEDNEQVYIGMLASSGTFVIQNVEDSTKLAAEGYASGFYPDGSYLDHSRVPYIGSYGIEFMKGGVKIPSLIGGTPWQYPDEVQQNLEYYIVEGFGSAIYRGLMLDSLKGRSVARPEGSNQDAGREAMTIILQMVDSLSDESRDTTLSALKYWLEQDTGYIDSLTGAENMAVKQRAQEILNDDAIEAYVAPLHKSFPLMDRAVHRTDDYLFALSMYSERIQNTEIMNDENRFGWHQGNGMTYIYDSDRDQYTDNFWNTVNPLRLPGTTVVPVNIGTGTPDSSGFAQLGDFCSYEDWVGGSSIGNYGISGMSFSGEISDKAKSSEISYAPNLKGKKSWFMFDDEIVSLGAGITNSGMDLPVETTVENKRLNEEGSNAFTVNGEAVDLPVKEANVTELVDRSADVSGTALENVTWAHLEGSESKGTGYYFPTEETTIQARRARTTGNWSDIGTFEGESTENYLELWFDHGENPEGASYSYVLLPETTEEETLEYAKDPDITVLMNTETAQAVYHKGLGITGINFWTDKTETVGDVTCDSQASVMLEETEDGRLTVAVSDPTMKNRGSITLKIDKPVAAEGEMDDNVTCEINDDGSATLTFQMKGTNGASSYAELSLAAAVYPAAVTLEKGESQEFELRDYEQAGLTAEWTAAGFESGLAAGTAIDENGTLTVDEAETNKALVVTAKTGSGLELKAYVSLGADAIGTLPAEMEKVQDTIDNALDMTEEHGAESEEAQKAVSKAVKAIQNADSDDLAEYLMDSILELSSLYEEVWAYTDSSVVDAQEITGEAVELEPVTARGMVLSISPSYTASPSNALLSISGGEEEGPIASPSNAETATPSNAKTRRARTATPSVTELEEINGKPVEKNTFRDFLFQMFREKEDGDRTPLRQKAPIQVEVSLPDCINPERPILAAVVEGNGRQHPIRIKLSEDGATLTMILTQMGTVVLANEAGEEPVEPEDPDPDDPKPPVTVTYEVFIDAAITGGRVTADKLKGPKDTLITLTAIPDAGYELEALMVNGQKVRTDEKGKYSFKLTEDTEVTARFAKKDPGKETGSDRHSSGSSSEKFTGGWMMVNGRWKYQDANGVYAVNGWKRINNLWYAFDENGCMRVGWYLEPRDGHWYYLKDDGSMALGWRQIDGIWYYFNPQTIGTTGWSLGAEGWTVTAPQPQSMPQGALYQSQTTPDGYQVDAQGAWIQ